MSNKFHCLLKKKKSPGWCGSVDWAAACEPKGCWFDSHSRHIPGLWAESPVGGVQEAATYWCFSPSLCSSLPLFLKINKQKIFKKRRGGEEQGRHHIAKPSKRLEVRMFWFGSSFIFQDRIFTSWNIEISHRIISFQSWKEDPLLIATHLADEETCHPNRKSELSKIQTWLTWGQRLILRPHRSSLPAWSVPTYSLLGASDRPSLLTLRDWLPAVRNTVAWLLPAAASPASPSPRHRLLVQVLHAA